jgi:hypothetical protein
MSKPAGEPASAIRCSEVVEAPAAAEPDCVAGRLVDRWFSPLCATFVNT